MISYFIFQPSKALVSPIIGYCGEIKMDSLNINHDEVYTLN